MTFFRTAILVCPIACLMAQTPPSPPKPAAPAAPPQPTVTLSAESPTAPPMPAIPPEKVVIAVGEQTLTFAQFQAIVDALPEQYRNAARGPGRRQLADNLVRIIVLAQEGKRRGLDKTPVFQTQADFQTRNILAAITADRMTKELKIGDAEVHTYYDAHKNEFEQVRARHILIRMQGSPVPVKPGQKDLSDADALAKAQELRTKIAGGADFANLAITESDDTGSGAKGGDLGFFRRGQMVPSFEQAAFSLKPGELSEPVKSQFGYHIIKVETHESRTFEEVRPELENKMRPEATQKAMKDLENKATVTLDPELFPAPTPAK
jgi:peptidyl-prolyl cis-trans isomerase C